MFGVSPLTWMLIVWAAVTLVFAVLMVYRALIGMREDDQIFLDPTEFKLAEEQHEIITRVERVTTYAKGFGWISAILLLAIAGVWLYRGLVMFNSASTP